MKKYNYLLLCVCVFAGCGITVEKIHSSKLLDESKILSGYASYYAEPEYDFAVHEEGPAELINNSIRGERVTKEKVRETRKLKEKFSAAFQYVLEERGIVLDPEVYDLHITYVPLFETISRPSMPLTSKMTLSVWGTDVKTKERVFGTTASFDINHNFSEGVIQEIVQKTLAELEFFKQASIN